MFTLQQARSNIDSEYVQWWVLYLPPYNGDWCKNAYEYTRNGFAIFDSHRIHSYEPLPFPHRHKDDDPTVRYRGIYKKEHGRWSFCADRGITFRWAGRYSINDVIRKEYSLGCNISEMFLSDVEKLTNTKPEFFDKQKDMWKWIHEYVCWLSI